MSDAPDFRQVAFTRDSLLVERVGSLRRKAWSPSSSKSVAKCPASWALSKILPLSPSPFDPAPIGTAVHAIFEVLFALPAPERTRQRAMDIAERLHVDYAHMFDPVKDPIPSDPVELDRWRQVVLERALGLFDVEDPRQVRVQGLERALQGVLVNGVPFNGRIDRTDLLVGDDGSLAGLRVVDYKSSAKGMKSDSFRQRFGCDHSDQGHLYWLAIANSDGRSPDSVEILYTATGQRLKVPVTNDSLARVAGEFKASFDLMNRCADRREYPCKPSPLCGWCPAATLCPSAARENRGEAQVDVGNLARQLNVKVIKSVNPTQVRAPHTLPATTKEVVMPRPVLGDGKPFMETDTDGTLAASSHAAQGVFEVAALALEVLHRAGLDQPRLESALVSSTAEALADVTLWVQRELSGEQSWQDGANARVRQALRAVIDTMPLEFGADAEQISAWLSRVQRRTLNVATLAVSLWQRTQNIAS